MVPGGGGQSFSDGGASCSYQLRSSSHSALGRRERHASSAPRSKQGRDARWADGTCMLQEMCASQRRGRGAESGLQAHRFGLSSSATGWMHALASSCAHHPMPWGWHGPVVSSPAAGLGRAGPHLAAMNMHRACAYYEAMAQLAPGQGRADSRATALRPSVACEAGAPSGLRAVAQQHFTAMPILSGARCNSHAALASTISRADARKQMVLLPRASGKAGAPGTLQSRELGSHSWNALNSEDVRVVDQSLQAGSDLSMALSTTGSQAVPSTSVLVVGATAAAAVGAHSGTLAAAPPQLRSQSRSRRSWGSLAGGIDGSTCPSGQGGPIEAPAAQQGAGSGGLGDRRHSAAPHESRAVTSAGRTSYTQRSGSQNGTISTHAAQTPATATASDVADQLHLQASSAMSLCHCLISRAAVAQ
jgi:hypothetical protein